MNSAPLPLLDALLAAVSDADSLSSLLDRALAQVRAAIGAATASIYLDGAEHPKLVALQGCDAFGQELNQAAETAGARQRAPTSPNQAPNDPRVRCLPLDTPQQTLGWLCLAFASTAPAPPADDDLLRTAARIIALGIAHIRDAERLQAQLHDAHELVAQQHRLALIGRLVPGVGHDLNNPLQAITGFAQLLLTDGELDASVQSDLRKIQSQGERAARLVENLLALARPSRSEPCAVQLQDALGRALELLAYPLRASGVEVQRNLPRPPLIAWVDPGRLHLMLVCLISRVLSALTSAGHPGLITISARQAGDRVHLTVSYPAPGAPPAPTTAEQLELAACTSLAEELGARFDMRLLSNKAALSLDLPTMASPRTLSSTPG